MKTAVDEKDNLYLGSILLLCLLTTSCGVPGVRSPDLPSQASPGEVQFKLAGPNEAAMVVPVKINGHGPYDFVLDTGATFTCVDRELAGTLKLPEWSGPLGTIVLKPGDTDMGLVKIDKLEVGNNVSASDLVACTIDLSRMQPPGFGLKGLVGLNFLKSYKVTIDFERNSVRLDARGP